MLLSTKFANRRAFSAEYQRHPLARSDLNPKIARLIDILVVGKPALPVTTMEHVPVPIACGGKRCRRFCNHRNSGSSILVSAYVTAVSLVLDQEMPVMRSLGCAVMIAVQAEGAQGQRHSMRTLFAFVVISPMQHIL